MTTEKENPVPDTPADTRFGLIVDDDNGYHLRFRLFAATGGQHLGLCGRLTMHPDEFEAFRALLEPALTDRPDPPAVTKEACPDGFWALANCERAAQMGLCSVVTRTDGRIVTTAGQPDPGS